MKWRDYVHQMFGAGLTQWIIDGYAAVVSVWQPGDLIYLFGFSRGRRPPPATVPENDGPPPATPPSRRCAIGRA
jgi:hypothetical protein